MNRGLQALGRLRAGSKNRCEVAYEAHLEKRRIAGEVAWYDFEAIKIRLADRTFLTVDFFVMLADGELQAHDCKGAKAIVTDDARVKLKVAAEKFPFRFFMCFPTPRSRGASWEIEEV